MILAHSINIVGEKKYTSREINDVLQQADSLCDFTLRLKGRLFNNTRDLKSFESIKKQLLESNSQSIRRKLGEMILESLESSGNGKKESLSQAYIDGVIDSLDDLINSVCLCVLGEKDSSELYKSAEDTFFLDKLFIGFKNAGKQVSKKNELKTEKKPTEKEKEDNAFELF